MKIHHRPKCCKGQTTTETVLLLPFYLLVVLGLLQIVQLATALIVVCYGASSIARKVSQDDDRSVIGSPGFSGSGPRPIQLGGVYESKFENLFVAGMERYGMWGCVEREVGTSNKSNPLATLTVYGSAKVGAFPLVGEFLKPALGATYRPSKDYCEQEPLSIGPFSFSGSPPYFFVVRGKASARLNYQP